MVHIEEFSKQILSLCSDPDITDEIKLERIDAYISWRFDDVFKLIKNINETSLNSFDRTNRLIELEQKYGIPKTHLLNL